MNDSTIKIRKKARHSCTDEAIDRCVAYISEGMAEGLAATRAGMRPATWSKFKLRHKSVQPRVNEARMIAGEKRYRAIMKEREERESMKLSAKAAKKTPPSHRIPKQVNLVRWVLTTQVSLEYVQIPEELVRQACDRYKLDYEQWLRMERKHSLMRKIYDRRARIRGNPALRPELRPHNSFSRTVEEMGPSAAAAFFGRQW
jgi:hypothetical protein